MASTLAKYIYTWGETTVSELYSGNGWHVDPRKPWVTIQYPAYCVARSAEEVAQCQNTGKTISGFLRSMGGNPDAVGFPGNDTNKLGFPCENGKLR